MTSDLLAQILKARAADKPIIVVIAGSNGAGRSTYYHQALATLGLPFINADDLARARTGSHAGSTDSKIAYEAMHEAEARRNRLFDERQSFVVETVLSDPVGSKLGFFKAAVDAGYYFVFVYIRLLDPEQSIARVTQRVAAGGHDVPDDKLIARFPRTLANATMALTFAHLGLVFDNSSLEQPYRWIETWENGVRTAQAAT